MSRLCPSAIAIVFILCALAAPRTGPCAESSLIVKITNNSSLALHFRFVETNGQWHSGQVMYPGEVLQPKQEKFCRLYNSNCQAELIFMVGSARPELVFSYGFKATYQYGGLPVISYRTQIPPKPPTHLKVAVSSGGVSKDGGRVNIVFQ